MTCPACGSAMEAPSFERMYGRRLTIDVCHHCQCLWFDDQEFLQMTPGATLQLVASVAEDKSLAREPWAPSRRCPRCSRALAETHDMQRNTGFTYYRCPGGQDRSVLSRVADVFSRHPEVKALYGIQHYIDPVTEKTLLTWGRETDPAAIKKRMYIPHPTLFVRREVYDHIGLFSLDYRVAMDDEFAIRLTKYTRPYFHDYKIACMRDTGTSGRQYQQAFRESVRALAAHGYYFAAFVTVLINSAKQILIWLGLKRLLYRLWEKNVSPR